MKTFWKKEQSNQIKPLYFSDIKVGESFTINTHNSQGAIYTKVDLNSVRDRTNVLNLYGMLEIETCKIFPSTSSPIKLVPVEVHIDSDRPNLYK